MATVGISSGPDGALSSSFVAAASMGPAASSAAASGMAGIAALDTPQLTQTKVEIRTLVAEIAELASADIESDEFMRGMLSRVCMAMGATAAAVWNAAADGDITLLSSHQLPAALRAETSDSPDAEQAHRRVLACVAAEGQPMLVPPGSVRIESERPANPIDEALLIVPIRVHNRVDALLEVIQPASGGPAAQRGYLRFVAQMADLLGDYLRRNKLRQLANEADDLKQLRAHLLQIATGASAVERHRALANAVARLLGSDLVLLLNKSGRRWQVRAISDLAAFDVRSEIVATAQRLISQLERSTSQFRSLSSVLTSSYEVDPRAANTVSGTDSAGNHSAGTNSSRTDSAGTDSSGTDSAGTVGRPKRRWAEVRTTSGTSKTPSVSSGDAGLLTQMLCKQLGCDQLVRLAWEQDGSTQLLLAVDKSVDLEQLCIRALDILPALGTTATAPTIRSISPVWLSSRLHPARTTTAPWWTRSVRWLARASIVGLVLAVAWFPMPNQVAVVAVLEAVQKQMYYAPSATTIDRVLVDSGQSIRAGDLMLQLSDKQLDAQLDEVTGQRLATDTQLTQDAAALKRGQLPPQQQDELESRMLQSKITIAALDEKLALLQSQSAQLSIVARRDAIVTTWDARNRLEGRPVAAGQLLVTTCEPDTAWQLQLSIAQHRAGMVHDALAASPQGLPVHFSLSSHPSEVRMGRLTQLSPQLVYDRHGSATVLGTVLVDASTLPAKTDGAVVRAAVDCGRIPAIWLALGDAYSEASAWIRMTW